MRDIQKFSAAVGLAAAIAVVLGASSERPVPAQSIENAPLQVTTQEHLQTEDWWPTKSTFNLKSFAGSETCVRCHTEESTSATAMQRAAALPPDAKFLQSGKGAIFSAQPLTYELRASEHGLDYSVSNGTQKSSHKLDWVMGAGELGRTFLYETDGRWYQSEATFYTHLATLDITTGLGFDPHASPTAALGQALSSADTRACFGCHTVHATTSAGFDPLHAEAGLGCEACHGPARTHVAEMGTASAGGKVGAHAAAAVFNPAKLSPADSIDFCGSCHRTFADASLSLGGLRSTAAVRFQPYRLEESKCWRATQSEKLTCVACHNPHAALNRDAASYDKKCLSCHVPHGVLSASAEKGTSPVAKVCPKATKDCTTCHMPKVNVASMHGDFTDHFIRIVKSEDGFPK